MAKNRKVLVKLQNISKTYGEGENAIHALQGVDLEVYEGELLMIVGPSGSGKTTLISIIAGILEHTAGICTVLDKEIDGKEDITEFRGKNIGFVFQAFNLIPMLTVEENVSIPLVINGERLEEALPKAREMLENMGMQHKVDTFPPQLSGGQQQRVAIARACVHNPSIIVCDEPTSALDHETGTKILTLLKSEVLQPGRTLIIVTHDARIFSFADRIVKVDDGKIISITEGPLQES